MENSVALFVLKLIQKLLEKGMVLVSEMGLGQEACTISADSPISRDANKPLIGPLSKNHLLNAEN